MTHQTPASDKGIQGQRTADLHVTPKNPSPNNIVKAIEKKSGQAEGVLVQADLPEAKCLLSRLVCGGK